MSETKNVDPRADERTAARVDRALMILEQEGMHAAFAYMQLAGVPRGVARRVLCSPTHQRTRDRRNESR
jgi:hypothetical protein